MQRSTEGTNRWLTTLAWVQGGYFLVTGLWPLLSIETFQLVTGRKTDHLVTGREGDHWLVMTVGVLVTAVALPVIVAASRRHISTEIVVLAIASAVGLAAIDVIYVARRAIAPIYLADAAIEVALICGWAYAVIAFPRQRTSE